MRQLIIDNYVINKPIEEILTLLKLSLTNGKLKDIENTPMSFYILNGLISISKLTLELTAYILSKYFKASNTLLSKRYLIII